MTTEAGSSKLSGRLAALQRTYVRVVGGTAVAMMAATVIITCVQVFCRYFLNMSIIWAEEVCRYLLIWTTFVAIGLAFQRGELASMDMLIEKLSHKIRVALLVPAYLVSAVFLMVVAYHGWHYAMINRIQVIPAADFIAQSLVGRDSGLTIFWIYVAVPFGCTLLAVHFMLSAMRMIVTPGPVATRQPT